MWEKPVEFAARPGYFSLMRRTLMLLPFLLLLAFPAEAASGRVIKVLPHFLDRNGQHTLSPSLYERDAYQARLRNRPELRSGIRFDVQWKARGASAAPLTLYVELRGIAAGELPRETVLASEVTPRKWFSQWTGIALTGAEYEDFGEVTAWRVSLWAGDELLGQQKSFLW